MLQGLAGLEESLFIDQPPLIYLCINEYIDKQIRKYTHVYIRIICMYCKMCVDVCMYLLCMASMLVRMPCNTAMYCNVL